MPEKDAATTSNASQPVVVNLITPDKNAEGARAMAEGRALEMDKTIPMGRYLVNGVEVNANGEPLKESKDA